MRGPARPRYPLGTLNAAPTLIAVVDDEVAVRRALRRLLTSVGYTVDMYDGGREFLAAMPARRPACIVLDLHMPHMDGFALMEACKRIGLESAVVVITGHDTAESRERVLALGAERYLRKPIDEHQLIASIEEAMREL